ncbi:MAG: hypothetical protein AMXMBFR13_32680 [Phycisphaerae bacterium]
MWGLRAAVVVALLEVAMSPAIARARTHVVAPGERWPRLSAGDVVNLRPGLYTFSPQLEIRTPRVTIRAEQKWTAVIRNSPRHGIAVLAPHVVLEGLEVRGSGISGIKVFERTRTSQAAEHVTIRDCWIHHNAANGIEAHGREGLVVEGCRISWNGVDRPAARPDGTPSRPHGVYASGYRHVYRENEIDHNAGHGLHLYGNGAEGTQGATIVRNVCLHNGSRQILVQGPAEDGNWEPNRIADNVCIGGWIGIAVWGGSSKRPTQVVGNTCAGQSLAPHYHRTPSGVFAQVQCEENVTDKPLVGPGIQPGMVGKGNRVRSTRELSAIEADGQRFGS